MKTTLILFGLLAATAMSLAHDLVLANGRVMDPATGLDAVRHVGITAGKISAISETPLQGGIVVDATDSVAAPGFIDLHAHGQTTSDLQIRAQDGVTTALELEGGVYLVAEWYARQQGTAPIHYGATVGHQSARFVAFHPELKKIPQALRGSAKVRLGPEPAGANKPAGPEEMRRITAAVREGLSEGALGVGFGINYTPGATVEEIEEVFRIAVRRVRDQQG
jgi:imidazolonepropionase-like amidohydrolase